MEKIKYCEEHADAFLNSESNFAELGEGSAEVDAKKKKQRECRGKVIRFFTIEVEDASSNPELYDNPSNPYNQLSDEEREKEFCETFALLLAESYRDAGRGMELENACNK
jgi:hypothetical protein